MTVILRSALSGQVILHLRTTIIAPVHCLILPLWQKLPGCLSTVFKKDRLLLKTTLSPVLKITDLKNELNDFADTAAVMSNLDLVISTDTAVVHLAGAMGKPVWTLLHSAPDWRWWLKRTDSPWYPSMRLFRQTQLNDWAGVFEQVKEALISNFARLLGRDCGLRKKTVCRIPKY